MHTVGDVSLPVPRTGKKTSTSSPAPRVSIDTSLWHMVQKKCFSEPVLDPLMNSSRTGWPQTMSRRSRFRELYVRFFCRCEEATLSSLCSTRETKASRPIIRETKHQKQRSRTYPPLFPNNYRKKREKRGQGKYGKTHQRKHKTQNNAILTTDERLHGACPKLSSHQFTQPRHLTVGTNNLRMVVTAAGIANLMLTDQGRQTDRTSTFTRRGFDNLHITIRNLTCTQTTYNTE